MTKLTYALCWLAICAAIGGTLALIIFHPHPVH